MKVVVEVQQVEAVVYLAVEAVEAQQVEVEGWLAGPGMEAVLAELLAAAAGPVQGLSIHLIIIVASITTAPSGASSPECP